MFAPLPFALQASAGCPPAAELALSLAASFGEVDSELVDAALGTLAERVEIDSARRGDPQGELAAVGQLCGSPAGLRPHGPMGARSLLLDHALLANNADPLLIAVALVEVGRRVGVPLGVVSNGEDHCVGHLRCPEPLVLLAATGTIVDGRELPSTLTWHCPHEVCGLLLDELEPRWQRSGHVAEAIRAAELRLCLPLDPDVAQAAALHLEQVRAALN